MLLSELNVIEMRPNGRVPKLISLALPIWQMLLLRLQLPKVYQRPQPEQSSGPNVYHLDCQGNDYRKRDVDGNPPGEPEVVLNDFPEIDVTGPVEALAELVLDHNVRLTREKVVRGVTKRSTRNKLNQAAGSLGFFTSPGYELISMVKATKWREIVDPQLGAIRPTPAGSSLDETDFLLMSLHMILTHLKAELYTEGREGQGKWDVNQLVVQRLMDMNFQGRQIVYGADQPLTLGSYIRNLFELDYTFEQINTLLAPWLSLWLQVERSLEQAKQLTPTINFPIGGGRGVLFDFKMPPGTPVHPGSNNPLIHNAWLQNEGSAPKASIVIVRNSVGQVAVIAKQVDRQSFRQFVDQVQTKDPRPSAWFYEDGFAFYGGGSRSRLGGPVPEIDMATLAQIASRSVKIYRKAEGRFPQEKYANR